jgi:hypothetical protein
MADDSFAKTGRFAYFLPGANMYRYNCLLNCRFLQLPFQEISLFYCRVMVIRISFSGHKPVSPKFATELPFSHLLSRSQARFT